METSINTDQILPALLAVRKAAQGVVPESGTNKHDDYTYSKLKDYHGVIRDAAHEHGLVILESSGFLHETALDRTTSTGKKQNAVIVTVTLRVIHAESGQWVQVTAPGEGQDRADKSTYKAITGARKYATALAFNLVTTADPEVRTAVI